MYASFLVLMGGTNSQGTAPERRVFHNRQGVTLFHSIPSQNGHSRSKRSINFLLSSIFCSITVRSRAPEYAPPEGSKVVTDSSVLSNTCMNWCQIDGQYLEELFVRDQRTPNPCPWLVTVGKIMEAYF